ncbi:MAG TPA: DUF6265 family protein [Allosphingosinicella sp.]|nr:DUF6265 family protein [Allosphingosinicella sp.]
MRIGIMVATAWLVAAASPHEASKLGWMSGRWVSEAGDRWTEENWSEPRAGMMLGSGRSGRGAQLRDWEFMRIAPDADGHLAFWGSPRGAPAVPFRLKSLSASEAVFENPRHDYPQRVVYRRDGEVLVATVSLVDGSNANSWRYSRR